MKPLTIIYCIAWAGLCFLWANYPAMTEQVSGYVLAALGFLFAAVLTLLEGGPR